MPNLGGGYAAIGASQTRRKATIQREAAIEIDFSTWGIPPDATILSLYMTPIASEPEHPPLRPLFLHSNVLPVTSIPPKIWIYGSSIANHAVPASSEVQFFVFWLPAGTAAIPPSHLMEAARKYSAHKHDEVVLPAHVAFESALGPPVLSAIRAFCSVEKAKEFLDHGATLYHQLNVLVPMICHITGAPRLQDSILSLLNRLRTLRNEIAHDGHLRTPLTQDNAAEFLTASVFGYRYALLLQSSIGNAIQTGRLPQR